MKEFRDKVAVITGAASGIGFGLAERCAQEGMKVVLAGINLDNLVQAQEALSPIGATTLCVRADVANYEDIKALAQKTLDLFGAVHLLVNNAGVGAGGPVWATTLADWQWVMNVKERNRPHGLQNPLTKEPLPPDHLAVLEQMQQAVEAGISSQEVADQTFRALREDRFCILTHPELNEVVQQRVADLLGRGGE